MPETALPAQNDASPEIRPVVILAGLFIAGVAAGQVLWSAILPWTGVSLLLAGITLPFCLKGKMFRWACLVFFLCGTLRMQADRIVGPHDLRHFVTEERRAVRVLARVTEAPEYDADKRKFSLVCRLEGPGMRGLVRVIAHRADAPVPLFYGDLLRLEGELFAPRPPTNPAEFDYAAFLARNKIFAFLTLKDPSRLRRIRPGTEWSFLRFSQKLKVAFTGYLDQAYPPEDAALMKGILFSDRSDLSARTRREFSISGLAHVLTVSGMNVSLIAAGFFLAFRLLGTGKKKAILFGMAGILLYTLVTGAQAPVVRSALMFLLWGIALLLDRDTDFLISIAFSAFLILLADPGQLFQLSFQLTYLATLAIFCAGVPLVRWWERLGPEGPGDVIEAEIALEPGWRERIWQSRGMRRARTWTMEALGVSLAVQAVLFPLLAWQFHYVPLAALPANLVVIPWMGSLMAAGILICFLGPLSAGLTVWAGWLTAPAVHGFGAFVSLSAGLPYSHAAVARFPGAFVLAVYLLLGLLLVPAAARFRRVLAASLVLWLAVFLAWQAGHQLLRPGVQVWFLDAGQGDCAVLFLRGKTVIVDGGPGGSYDAGERILTPFLYSEGVRSVDLAVCTHPHADHVGGLPAVLDNFRVRTVLDSGRVYTGNRPFRAMLEKVRANRIPFRQAQVGEDLAGTLGLKEMSLRVLNTASSGRRNLEPRRGAHLDDDSVVLRLRTGGMTLLLTGDIRERTQQRLAGMPGLRSDILKAPHHGGDKYMVPAFYRAVSPRDTVILAGKNNRFGFPGKRTLRTLEALGSRVWRTDRDGAICVETCGESYKIKPYLGRSEDAPDRP